MLRRPVHQVNMRLYTENKYYRQLVGKVIEYMKFVIKIKFSDYAKLSGLSGANVAIPYNIIAVIRDDGDPFIMINPSIVSISKQTKEVSSNCGSINLEKPVKVKRRLWVEVSFYSEDGDHLQKRFTLADAGGAIQHEIDHNRGVLITDKDKHL